MSSIILQYQTPREIIKELIFSYSINNSILANAIGVHSSTIGRLLDGKTKSPKDKLLRPISDYFNLTLEQIKGIQEIPWDSLRSVFSNNINIPMYPWIMNSVWEPVKDLAGKLTTIAVDKHLSKDTFFMQLVDSSMEPLFPKKTKIICDPHKEYKDRSYIIVKPHNLNMV